MEQKLGLFAFFMGVLNMWVVAGESDNWESIMTFTQVILLILYGRNRFRFMGGDAVRGRSAPDDVCGTVSLPQAMSPGLCLGHQTLASPSCLPVYL